MILFEEDWYKYPNAIVNTRTTNRSFLRMAVLLKKMGVRNNKFFLALLDKELQGIDPHNLQDPSMEIKLRIAREVKRNPFYHFREVARVPAVGVDNIPYVLNRANLALMWTFFNNIDSFITQARQTGKTVSSIGICDWLLHLGTTNFTMHMITKGTDLVQENVLRLKTSRDGNPKYLITKSSKDTDNKEGISYHSLNTKCRTKVAQANKKAARALCIGETVPTQFWDEFAYIVNNKISYEAALPAISTASEQAREAGIPCASILSTTAGDLQDPAGKYAFTIKNNAMKFYEGLYDVKNIEELTKILDINSTNRIMYIEYSYLQLGKTHEWFKENTRKISDRAEIEKDYLNIWQVGTGTCPVPKHILDRISQTETDPLKCTLHESLIVRWYAEPDLIKSPEYKNKAYIIGVDTSDNVGRDSTTIYMLDSETLTTVSVCDCNVSNLAYVAQLIVKLLMDFPRSFLIPERNYNGGMLIDLILIALKGKGIDPWKRIYNTVTQEMNADTDMSIFTRFPEGPIRKHFGFRTSRSETSRKLLYKSVLLNLLELMCGRVYDKSLISQIKGLEIRNGRVDHSEGGHDDIVISWLLTGFFVLYGKNLHMYDINKEDFLKQVDLKGNNIDPMEKQRQLELRERLKKLEDLRDSTRSSLMKKSFEGEIKHLRSYINDMELDTEVVSVDQATTNAENEIKYNSKTSSNDLQQLFENFF